MQYQAVVLRFRNPFVCRSLAHASSVWPDGTGHLHPQLVERETAKINAHAKGALRRQNRSLAMIR